MAYLNQFLCSTGVNIDAWIGTTTQAFVVDINALSFISVTYPMELSTMEPTILNLNDIPAHLARRSVVAALTFIKRIEEVYQPHDLANIDFSLAKGIRHLHDLLTADFRPMPPDFSIAVHCSDPVRRGFAALGEPLSCAISCTENLLSFGCSTSINSHVISETLFRINLARQNECGSLPQLLSWIAISEMIFQENLTRIEHRFTEEFFTQ